MSDDKEKPSEPPFSLENHKMSAGEKIFDRGVYTGIGMVANEIGSLLLTGQLERGVFSNWYHNKAAPKVAKWFYNDNIKNAKNGMMWFSLTLVGTALVWPMKVMEDHKAAIVKKIDHFMDRFRGEHLSSSQVEKRDAEVEAAVACEKKQSWPSLIVGRSISICTSMGLSRITRIPFGKEKRSFGERSMEWTDNATTWAAKGVNKVIGSQKIAAAIDAPRTGNGQSGLHYYGRLLAPETIGCTATSLVLEGSSKLISKVWAPKFKDAAFCQAIDEGKSPLEIVRERKKGKKTSHVEVVENKSTIPEAALSH